MKKGTKSSMSRKEIKPDDRFGRLTVIKQVKAKRKKDGKTYLCKCDCGNNTVATGSHLRANLKKSCGCLLHERPANSIDVTGKRYGLLTVIKYVGTKNERSIWLCKCDCGNKTEVELTNLTSKNTRSCGCGADYKKNASKARKYRREYLRVDGVDVPSLQRKTNYDSKTHVKGVTIVQRKTKGIGYKAVISILGKKIHLGIFDDINDAIKARKKAELKYHQPYIEKFKEKNK